MSQCDYYITANADNTVSAYRRDGTVVATSRNTPDAATGEGVGSVFQAIMEEYIPGSMDGCTVSFQRAVYYLACGLWFAARAGSTKYRLVGRNITVVGNGALLTPGTNMRETIMNVTAWNPGGDGITIRGFRVAYTGYGPSWGIYSTVSFVKSNYTNVVIDDCECRRITTVVAVGGNSGNTLVNCVRAYECRAPYDPKTSPNFRMMGCHLEDCVDNNIPTFGIQGLVIQGCTFLQRTADTAIYIILQGQTSGALIPVDSTFPTSRLATYGATIVGNYFGQNGPPGVAPTGMIVVENGTLGCVIVGNTFVSAGLKAISVMHTARGVSIHGNSFVNCPSAPLSSYTTYPGCITSLSPYVTVGSNAYYNTFYRPSVSVGGLLENDMRMPNGQMRRQFQGEWSFAPSVLGAETTLACVSVRDAWLTQTVTPRAGYNNKWKAAGPNTRVRSTNGWGVWQNVLLRGSAGLQITSVSIGVTGAAGPVPGFLYIYSCPASSPDMGPDDRWLACEPVPITIPGATDVNLVAGGVAVFPIPDGAVLIPGSMETRNTQRYIVEVNAGPDVPLVFSCAQPNAAAHIVGGASSASSSASTSETTTPTLPAPSPYARQLNWSVSGRVATVSDVLTLTSSGHVVAPALGVYSSDATAAAAGVPVGGLYRVAGTSPSTVAVRTV